MASYELIIHDLNFMLRVCIKLQNIKNECLWDSELNFGFYNNRGCRD